MQIKKAGGKIFGASLTAAEQKAMNMEIQRQLVEYDRKNELELDAIILWELHTQLGLGPKRLKKFFDGFSDALNALVNRYEMDISDDVWLCTHKLKEIGVDRGLVPTKRIGGVLACPRTIRIRTKRAIPTRQRMKPCEKSTRRMPVFTDFLTRSSIFASWQASESKAVLC